jgi:hypothetical protein
MLLSRGDVADKADKANEADDVSEANETDEANIRPKRLMSSYWHQDNVQIATEVTTISPILPQNIPQSLWK